MAMEHRDLTAPATKGLDGLRREADFRDQHNRFLTLAHHFLNGSQIDFCLAAAGDAMQQEGVKPSLPKGLLDRRPGAGLVAVQRNRKRWVDGFGVTVDNVVDSPPPATRQAVPDEC